MADTPNPESPAKASLFKRHWDKPIIAVVLVVVSLQFFDYILSNESLLGVDLGLIICFDSNLLSCPREPND